MTEIYVTQCSVKEIYVAPCILCGTVRYDGNLLDTV